MKTANEIIEEFDEMFSPNEASLAKNIETYSTATEVIIAQRAHQQILRIKSFILQAMKTAVEEVTPVKTQGESVMLEHGSEYTTPRMYRAFGFNSALSDLEEKRKQFFKE